MAGDQTNDLDVPSKPDDEAMVGQTPSWKLASGLYLVATPLGNARDITLRALDTLRQCDVIACEDTRVTAKLLAIYNISKKLIMYNDTNGEPNRAKILDLIEQQEMAVALVSDAGTPLIADPGYRLVQECLSRKLKLHAVPGANAAVTALTLSGLPVDRYFFAGFLSNKGVARAKELTELATIPASLIFYEASPRLIGTLNQMIEILGPRQAVVAREITKFYEEILRAPLPQLLDHFQRSGPPKGEIVLMVGPPSLSVHFSESDLTRLLKLSLAEMSLKDAVDQVLAATGVARKLIYRLALDLQNDR